MAEAEREDPSGYATFNQFFTRTIKPNLRPITLAANAFTSPSDGKIYQLGSLQDPQLLHAKGHCFTLQALLGPNINSQVFNNGAFINIYLSPLDYHRVHMPITGILHQMAYVPGKLFAVNNATANYIPNLFARNERVINIFHTEYGAIAIILVGAMLVGSIQTTWAGTINPKHAKEPYSINYTKADIKLSKGQEMGLFQMGSTVIVLLENSNIAWEPTLTANTKILMGQTLGTL